MLISKVFNILCIDTCRFCIYYVLPLCVSVIAIVIKKMIICISDRDSVLQRRFMRASSSTTAPDGQSLSCSGVKGREIDVTHKISISF